MKTGIVKEKKDLLDLLMDMYDDETDTKMEDDELRAQVMYLQCSSYKPYDWSPVKSELCRPASVILYLSYLSQPVACTMYVYLLLAKPLQGTLTGQNTAFP